MERKELINLIKEELCDTSISDIDKALSRIAKNNSSELVRLRVNRDEEIKESKLFDVSINDAIKYLKTFDGNLILEQRWSGYEDNYFVATKADVENNEEYVYRLSRVIARELNKMRKEEKELARKREELSRLKSEITKLERTL